MTREGIFHESCFVSCAAESLIVGAGFSIKIRAFNRSTGFINGRQRNNRTFFTSKQCKVLTRVQCQHPTRESGYRNCHWGHHSCPKLLFSPNVLLGQVPHKHSISRNFTKQTNQQQTLISRNSQNSRISRIAHQSLYGKYLSFPGFS